MLRCLLLASGIVFANSAYTQGITIQLSQINGDNGFAINGATGELSGFSVSSAGDFNGDGYDDVVVMGVDFNRDQELVKSKAYVVFGSDRGFSASLELSDLDGETGFAIVGVPGGSGVAAGDINGDGFSDIIIGAAFARVRGVAAGAVYVIFGTDQPIASPFNVSTLNGSNGFMVSGGVGDGVGNFVGQGVASAGDMNGDGYDDVVIVAGRGTGSIYVLFGSRSPFAPLIDVSKFDETNGFDEADGFVFRGPGGDLGSNAGTSVASAGDINGDGLSDIVIGAREVPSGRPLNGNTGGAYVILGSRNPFKPTLRFGDLDGSIGFTIVGVSEYDNAGASVASAGDLNADGLNDIVISVPRAKLSGNRRARQAVFVVFGTNQAFTRYLKLSDIDGDNGFVIVDSRTYDSDGINVSPAGDFNIDGINDLIIGAPSWDNRPNNFGYSFVIFGSRERFANPFDLSTIGNNATGRNGLELKGARDDSSGSDVAPAGDINGDGASDLIIGATGASPNGLSSGRSYVVFGRNFTNPTSITCGAPPINRAVDQGIFVWQDCIDGVPSGQWHLLATGGDAPAPIRYNGVIQGETLSDANTVLYERADILEKRTNSLAFVMRMLARGRDGINFRTSIDEPVCLDVTLNNKNTPPLYVGASRRALNTLAPVDITTGNSCALNAPLKVCGRPSFSGKVGLYVWESCGTGKWYMAAVSGGRNTRFSGLLAAGNSLSNVRPVRFESNDSVRVLTQSTLSFDMRVTRGNSDVVAFSADTDSNQSLCLRLNQELPVYIGRYNMRKARFGGLVNLSSNATCDPPR